MLFAFFIIVFQNSIFGNKSPRNTIRVTNGLDPDHNLCSVFPDLCKGYQQTTEVVDSNESLENNLMRMRGVL